MCYTSQNSGCSLNLQAVLRVANGATVSENIAVKSFRFSPPTPFAVVSPFQGRLYFNYSFSKIPLGLRSAANFFHTVVIFTKEGFFVENFSGPEGNSISEDVAIPQGGHVEIRGTIGKPFFHYTGTATVTMRITTSITDSLGNTTPTDSEYVFTSCDLKTQGPTASFETTRDDDEGGRIRFTDTSTPGSAPIVSWFWEFEDGATSTEQNPSYRYTTPGEKDIRLTVTDSLGNSNLVLLTGLEILASNFTPPTVNFSLQRSGALELTINDLSQAGERPYTLEVNWGDGNTEAIPAGDSVVHVYSTGATRPVTLTATDQAGNVVARTLRYALPYDGPQPLGPVADFIFSNTGNTYQFTDESQPSNTGDQTTMGTSTIAVWQWDFGDGNTSTEQNPEHLYTDPGTYYPKLRVVDANGLDSIRFTLNPITIQ